MVEYKLTNNNLELKDIKSICESIIDNFKQMRCFLGDYTRINECEIIIPFMYHLFKNDNLFYPLKGEFGEIDYLIYNDFLSSDRSTLKEYETYQIEAKGSNRCIRFILYIKVIK